MADRQADLVVIVYGAAGAAAAITGADLGADVMVLENRRRRRTRPAHRCRGRS